MTRLAVVADVHCDDFGSKIDPATGLNARWVDTIAMLAWVARDARGRGADALIVAGDLSEARHPAPWRVAQIGEAIAEFGGPTILARGNHDGLKADRSIVDVLAAGRPGWDGYSRPGITMLGTTAIAVLPYLDKHHARALPGYESVPEADVFTALAATYLTIASGLYITAQQAGATATVLVVHQGLAGGSMSDAQQVFLGDHSLVVDTRALAAIGFDAILAGHFHKHQVLLESPLVAYAGAPYRTDFGEEHQAKGYLIVDVERDGTTGIVVPSWTFVETPARRFVTLTAECGYNVDEVRDAVVRCIDVDPELDVAHLRSMLEADGVFDLQEIRRRPREAQGVAGGLAETLSPIQALEAFFAADPEREVLVGRGRELLAEVA